MKRNILFVMAVLMCFSNVKAQTPIKVDKKEKQEIIDVLDKWYAKYDSYRNGKRSATPVLNEKSKIAENAKLEFTLDSLMKIKNVVNDSLSNYTDAVIYSELHKKFETESQPLLDKVNKLKGLREQWNSDLAAGAENKWLNKNYRNIDVNELELEYKRFENSGSTNQKIQKTKAELAVVLANTKIYKAADHAVNNAYNPENVRKALDGITKIIANEKNAQNKIEMQELQKQLSSYADKVKKFYSVIELVEKQQNRFPNHDRSIRFVDMVLKQQQNVINEVKNNPWLSEQYEKFDNALHENCLVEGESQKSIKELYNKYFNK